MLHFVCKHIRVYKPTLGFKVLWCVKQLLHLGFDPRDRNGDNETALDVLIHSFQCPYFIGDLHNEQEAERHHYTNRLYPFVLNASMLWCRGSMTHPWPKSNFLNSLAPCILQWSQFTLVTSEYINHF